MRTLVDVTHLYDGGGTQRLSYRPQETAPIPNIAVVGRDQIRIDHAEAIYAAKESGFSGAIFEILGLEAL